jgi:cytoskeletal protein CcmA (bactofilin family)
MGPQIVGRSARNGEEFSMDTREGTGWRRLVPGVPAAVETAAPQRTETDPGGLGPNVALISSGVEMEGRLLVPNSVQIEGEFRGQLESASAVWVSESGSVEAPIKARTVEIRGAVVGDIVATREVVIHPTGRLHGNVETPSLVIARGATFNGSSRMYRPERGAQGPAPETRA